MAVRIYEIRLSVYFMLGRGSTKDSVIRFADGFRDYIDGGLNTLFDFLGTLLQVVEYKVDLKAIRRGLSMKVECLLRPI